MKKILLLLTLFACFSFTAIESKEASNEIVELVNSCPSNSSAVYTSCWSGCISMMPVINGNCLECDVAAINEGPRKPTDFELMVLHVLIQDSCLS